MVFTACHKPQSICDAPIVGHWGCEEYISCRIDSLGTEQWDTLQYKAEVGQGYEVFFYDNWTGKLILNDSPAFIKTFYCDYEYDSVHQAVSIQSQAWLYALYGHLYLEENQASFKLEKANDTLLWASWYNTISEPEPFYEWFHLKKIE